MAPLMHATIYTPTIIHTSMVGKHVDTQYHDISNITNSYRVILYHHISVVSLNRGWYAL